jgi:uncharacterized protein YndB with AHSA1/START domain
MKQLLSLLTVLGSAFLAALAWSNATAEVVNVAANGFKVREQVHIKASPDEVYSALIQPARWWASDHTFSHSAANLTLAAHAGGCFCEKLPNGGSVQHQIVILAAPGKQLVLRGPLGPFQTFGVDGSSNWVLSAAGDGTDLILTNTLGGFIPEGFEEWAKRADAMMAGTVDRLKRFMETGAADVHKEEPKSR